MLSNVQLRRSGVHLDSLSGPAPEEKNNEAAVFSPGCCAAFVPAAPARK